MKSKHVECGKTKALYDARLKEIADRETKRLERIADVDRLAPSNMEKPSVMRAYAIHFKDIYTAQTKRSLKTGKPIDASRLDMMTAVRLRMTGHSKEDVQTAITVMSPSLRQELGKDPNAHKWEDYAERTAAAAFGYYGDRETERRKALATRGRARYDKTHPDETSERETLKELYEQNVRYLDYISNPISQPTGHKHDIDRAARIMEIESSRALTEAETIAKHDGVRKVFEMADRYRGREIDRGLGR